MIQKRETYLWAYVESFIFLYKKTVLLLYLLNQHYYFLGYIHKQCNIDQYNNTFTYNFSVQVEEIVRSSIILYWKKILFKGKSYKIKLASKNTKITLRMGFSHWTKFRLHNFSGSIRKYKRQKFIIFTYSFYSLYRFLGQLTKIRPINPYTKRGLRLTQQYIKRRSGKLSQVLSSLH